VAQEPLLAGFCSHASTAEFISKLIEKERPDDLLGDRDKLRRYTRLLGMRVRETAAMSALATKMRLTQQSQIQPRSAGRLGTPTRLGRSYGIAGRHGRTEHVTLAPTLND
jgi:hypothetical protein